VFRGRWRARRLTWRVGREPGNAEPKAGSLSRVAETPRGAESDAPRACRGGRAVAGAGVLRLHAHRVKRVGCVFLVEQCSMLLLRNETRQGPRFFGPPHLRTSSPTKR
jgi:hypothetical protein